MPTGHELGTKKPQRSVPLKQRVGWSSSPSDD